jgi:hypothetical protein
MNLFEVWEANVEKDGLSDGSSEGHHSKASVLDFLVLQLGDLFFSLSVEEAGSEIEVTGFTSRSLQHFSNGEPRDDLEEANEDKGISHDSVLDHDVVGGGRAQSLTKRVNDNSLVNGDVSNNGKLANTSVPDENKHKNSEFALDDERNPQNRPMLLT